MSKIEPPFSDKMQDASHMDWDKLRIFHSVAEAGSFTHAGDRLHLSQSAVSRQISALEDVLGVLLFHRHARGLILTEQGEILHRTVKEVFSKLALTQAFLSETKEKASGTITVTTTSEFGIGWLIPKLPLFYKNHRDVQIALLLEDAELDLSMREADVAIRMHPPTQPDLIQRQITRFHMPLYASKSYLKQHEAPVTLENLHAHPLISFKGHNPPFAQMNWFLERLKEQTNTSHKYIALKLNNLAGIHQAIRSSIGIGCLPSYLAQNDSELVPLLTEIQSPPIEAYFVYPEELRTSKRIAVFRDFLLKELQKENKKLE